MKDILILVPTKFEDVELTGVADVFDRENISYDFVSIHNKDSEDGSHFVSIKTKRIADINPDEYNGVFLPGGPIGSQYLDNSLVVKILKEYNAKQKWMTAICAAPETFLKLGFLDNIKYTAHPDYASGPNKSENDICIDKNFITGKNFMTAMALGEIISASIKEK